MPLAKTIKEGNTTTEVHDLMGGVGKLSVDEVLAGTGGKAGTFTEIQPDGSKITYFVEEVSFGTSDQSILIKQQLYGMNSTNLFIIIDLRKKSRIMKLQSTKSPLPQQKR